MVLRSEDHQKRKRLKKSRKSEKVPQGSER